ncbi:hypothetical protein LJC63_03405 [Ruminococcaceae bacterium OttesenSCG-928-L11]|nr:hypothetical protein [Ruminococcaceae bacterium OttesenSCG-928-L11]
MKRKAEKNDGPSDARKLLQLLGICKKAGKLAEGFDPVAEAANGGKASLILTAMDLSPKSEKEIVRIAESNRVERLKTAVTMDEIWSMLSRRSGILAVLDDGLAETVKGAAEALQPPPENPAEAPLYEEE